MMKKSVLILWSVLAALSWEQVGADTIQGATPKEEQENIEHEKLGVVTAADGEPTYMPSFYNEDGDPTGPAKGDDLDLIPWATFLELLPAADGAVATSDNGTPADPSDDFFYWDADVDGVVDAGEVQWTASASGGAVAISDNGTPGDASDDFFFWDDDADGVVDAGEGAVGSGGCDE